MREREYGTTCPLKLIRLGGAPAQKHRQQAEQQPERPRSRCCRLGAGHDVVNAYADISLNSVSKPRGKDVLLVFLHRLPGDRAQKISIASGWDVHAGILADVLNGVETRPFWTTHGRLEKEYEAALQAPRAA